MRKMRLLSDQEVVVDLRILNKHCDDKICILYRRNKYRIVCDTNETKAFFHEVGEHKTKHYYFNKLNITYNNTFI